jgi:antitoxin MazE
MKLRSAQGAGLQVVSMQDDDDKEPDANRSYNAADIRRLTRDELIERLRAFRGRLPDDFKFDRGEANSR